MTTTTAATAAQPATTARPAKMQVRQPKPLPAPNSDFYDVYETLSAEELATVKRVRAFMEARSRPSLRNTGATKCGSTVWPFELLSE
jgi:hypothetical protein